MGNNTVTTTSSNMRSGLIIGMISAIAFSTLGTFTVILNGYGMSSDAMTCLLPLALTAYFGISTYIHDKTAFKVSKKMIIILILLGFLGFDGQNYCLIQAYSWPNMPFGLVSAIAFTNAFLVMVGVRILFGNKFTKQKIIAGIACTIGVILVLDLIAVAATGGFTAFNPKGLLWVLGAWVTIAASYVAMKYCMENGVHYLATFFYMNLFATIVWFIFMFSPVQLASEVLTAIDNGGLLALLGFVFITCILSFHLWAVAISKIDPSWVAIAYSLNPVVETLFGMLIFAQIMNCLQLLGIVIIILAVGFVSYLEGKEDKAATETTANN